MTEPRWYCVNRIGVAALCLNEKDAKYAARHADDVYPQHAPHRAVQLIDAAEVAELSRWKSTNAPRLEALQGLLDHERAEAAKGREAIASLASERAANAILTDEVAGLRAEVERLRTALAALNELDVHTGMHT